ncbi:MULTISPECIES: hypothetical protein [unclassified Rhizobium]|jgi:hypothetical protein|uniref:hypothetical protein n=1 Tax=unclassified Rhizobium TaxID=2613769 RepID=UPI0013AFD382|nr:hypothetical protein [Rhizobium sp. UBA1881]
MNGFLDLLTAGQQTVRVVYLNGRYLHDVNPHLLRLKSRCAVIAPFLESTHLTLTERMPQFYSTIINGNSNCLREIGVTPVKVVLGEEYALLM